ncbi:VOC family protein [Kribbella sp. NPDC051770]|uniref:VOC family protein n=1 Tax=Kribbella sp. NPDC051770 TaxID=3155413 RepID=UPI003429F930
MTVTPIPRGYTSVTPWMISADTNALMDWLTAAFDAEDCGRVVDDQGVVGHAEMRIGNAMVMMFDSKPDWPLTPAFLRLYVDDADATHRQALAAGGTSITEPTELFWGDRVGRVRDPFGNLYWLQTRVVELTEAEVVERMNDPKFIAAMEYVQGADFFPGA